MNTHNKTNKLAKMAMLVAISIVLVALIHFPIFPAAGFLEYDPADIPIFIGTFAFGPAAGMMITAVTCILQGVTVSSQSGLYGIIMHFIATGAFVLVAGPFYAKNKTRKGAAIALIAGTIVMALVMALANLAITPYFMKVPVEVVQGMILPVIVPFNLIKAGVNSIITFFVYKRISNFLHK